VNKMASLVWSIRSSRDTQKKSTCADRRNTDGGMPYAALNTRDR
jgi:hypothetical protein